MRISRSALGARVALLCVLGAVLPGCAAPEQSAGQHPLPADGIIYESAGEIAAVRVAGAKEQEQAFIWEWIGRDEALWAGPDVTGEVRRLLRVDLATGETTLMAEERCTAFPVMEGMIAVSTKGRWASVETGRLADPIRSRVLVGDRWGTPTPVTPWGEGLRGLPRWSPDGTALLYVSVKYEEFPRFASLEAVAVAVPRRARIATEIAMTRPGYWCEGLDWAPNSKRVYLISRGTDDGECLAEAVEWPTLKRQTIMKAGGLGRLSVARATGDVVFTQVQEMEPGERADSESRVLWRLRADDGLEQTGARVDRPPLAMIVSPEGERVAVLLAAKDSEPTHPRAEALMVYELGDGSSQRVGDCSGTLSESIHWVFGGRALVFPEGKSRVRLAVIEPRAQGNGSS